MRVFIGDCILLHNLQGGVSRRSLAQQTNIPRCCGCADPMRVGTKDSNSGPRTYTVAQILVFHGESWDAKTRDFAGQDLGSR